MGKRHMVYTPQREEATVWTSERSDGPKVLWLQISRRRSNWRRVSQEMRKMCRMIVRGGTEDGGGFQTNANKTIYVHNEEVR